MTKREKQLQLVRNRISRMEASREAAIKMLVRATLELPKLRKEEARLERAVGKRKVDLRVTVDEKVAEVLETQVESPKPDSSDPGELPTFLRRGMAAQKAVDKAIADHVYEAAHAVANAHNKPPTEEQKKLVAKEKRRVKEEHKHALLTGQKRKWPATGKQALAQLK